MRGEHLASCRGLVEHDGRLVECTGCLPAMAERGVLCVRCWGRLQQVVRTMPALADHLESMAAPGVRAVVCGPSGHSSRPGEGSLYPEAAAVLDELHAVLAAWCAEVAVERGLAVPVRGTRWTEPDGDGDREPIGPARPGATARLVAWLDPHLPWCAAQGWAGDMLTDLVQASGRALSRFPVEMAERPSTVPCPGCGCQGLLVMPPVVAGAQQVVRCRVCGMLLGEEEWERTRSRAVVVARAEQDGSGA